MNPHNPEILAELERLYPDARPALHFDNPYQLLVAVMLSAQCSDVKVNLVTPALFAAYPDAHALAAAEPETVEPYIQTCGLSVRFDLNETPQVMGVYRRLNPGALIGFYRVDHYGTRQIQLTPLRTG